MLEQKINQSFLTIEMSQLNPLYLHAHYKYEALYNNNWESLYKLAESYPKFLNDVIDELKEQESNLTIKISKWSTNQIILEP